MRLSSSDKCSDLFLSVMCAFTRLYESFIFFRIGFSESFVLPYNTILHESSSGYDTIGENAASRVRTKGCMNDLLLFDTFTTNKPENN